MYIRRNTADGNKAKNWIYVANRTFLTGPQQGKAWNHNRFIIVKADSSMTNPIFLFEIAYWILWSIIYCHAVGTSFSKQIHSQKVWTKVISTAVLSCRKGARSSVGFSKINPYFRLYAKASWIIRITLIMIKMGLEFSKPGPIWTTWTGARGFWSREYHLYGTSLAHPFHEIYSQARATWDYGIRQSSNSTSKSVRSD